MITALLGTGGLALIIPKAIEGVKAWRSGRALEEKATNKSLVDRLALAEAKADGEAEYRRQIQEYAGSLRVWLVNRGVPVSELPPWPKRRDNTLTD
ncbi:hypothetical protein [Arthrobacter sp. B1805]|uniref:hypothetical protein n=1 Tax=Arthrobacter sp. B1805 TaxID=2058892 RepID=UPI0011B0A8D9|nr:hypothetical protein [Arthrobacter sp. B1805]